MFIVLRLMSLLLVVAALMLLGADLITSLEKGGEITVRSLEHVWSLLGKSSAVAFSGWLTHSLPAPLPHWCEAVLALPGWGVTGVLGVVLAFAFGRRAGP
jgi:hypothetical protein